MTLPGATLEELCVVGGDVIRLDEREGASIAETLGRVESEAGVTLDQVADQLQADGIAAFAASWASLLQTITDVNDQMQAR